MKLIYKHPVTNSTREAPQGFSWTMLFFGVFVPMLRGDWKWFFIGLLLGVLTFGFSWLVLPFIYNKIFSKELVEKGYERIGYTH